MATVDSRSALVGNRWVLVGGILYLSQLVALIGAGSAGVGEFAIAGLSTEHLLKTYVGHVDVVALVAAWFSICQLGRVLVFVGIRSALADSGGPHLLLDFAVAVQAVFEDAGE